MQITQIRNATIIVEYKNTKFLIDPWLGPKDYMQGFMGAINAEICQPRVELPFDIDKIIDVDCVIVTHIHPDHWDEYAEKSIDKSKKFFVQSECDKSYLMNKGFKNIEILSEAGTVYNEITLYKTAGQHGKKEIIEPICKQLGMAYDAMGVVFKSESEKTLYVAGDTIYCEEVDFALNKFKPDIVVVNACGATVLTGDRIIMKQGDIDEILKVLPAATIIASHLDTVSHLSVTREDLRKYKKDNNVKNLLIPEDGETLKL